MNRYVPLACPKQVSDFGPGVAAIQPNGAASRSACLHGRGLVERRWLYELTPSSSVAKSSIPSVASRRPQQLVYVSVSYYPVPAAQPELSHEL